MTCIFSVVAVQFQRHFEMYAWQVLRGKTCEAHSEDSFHSEHWKTKKHEKMLQTLCLLRQVHSNFSLQIVLTTYFTSALLMWEKVLPGPNGDYGGSPEAEPGSQILSHRPIQEQGSQGAVGQPQPRATGTSMGTSQSQEGRWARVWPGLVGPMAWLWGAGDRTFCRITGAGADGSGAWHGVLGHGQCWGAPWWEGTGRAGDALSHPSKEFNKFAILVTELESRWWKEVQCFVHQFYFPQF